MSPSDSLLCFCRPAVVTTFLRFRSLLVNARSLFLPSEEDEESDDDDREESEDWQGAWDVFCKEVLELINKR